MTDNKEIEIDFYESTEVKAENIQLPLNFISIGQIENDDIKIYIKQDIYKHIEKYSASDKAKELGGILIGDYIEELGKRYVVITHYIEAKYTDASVSTLTFTHESWQNIHEEHSKICPEKKIIGWQHTHPDYGIFLSNYDTFIHENFFNLPFQIAYVVDPIKNIRGFFQWKNEKVQKIGGFFIYDDLNKKIDIRQNEPPKNTTTDIKIISKLNIVISILLCIMFIGLIFNSVNNFKLKSNVQTLKSQISKVEAQNTQYENEYNTVKGQNDELSNKLEELKKTYALNDKDYERIIFAKFVVKKGDTIYSICKKMNIDYLSNAEIIKHINKIDNLGKIYEGETLLLPASK